MRPTVRNWEGEAKRVMPIAEWFFEFNGEECRIRTVAGFNAKTDAEWVHRPMAVPTDRADQIPWS